MTGAFELSGKVDEFPLGEGLQFLGMTRKMGALQVACVRPPGEGVLYFAGGRLLHAECDNLQGIGALERLLSWEEGSFRFLADHLPPHSTLDHGVEHLLLDLQRRSDELRRLDRELPPDHAVLHLLPTQDDHLNLTRMEWSVITRINGRRTIRRICEQMGRELEIKQMLHHFLLVGLAGTCRGEEAWKDWTPRFLNSSEYPGERHPPAQLRTNLMLKKLDGQTTLGALGLALNIRDRDLQQDIIFLHQHHWILFPPGQEEAFLAQSTDW